MCKRWSWLMGLAVCLTLVSGCPGDDDDSVGDDDDVSGDDDTGDDDSDIAPTAYGIKKLLLEGYTNTGCGSCADANPTIDAFLDAVGVGNVIAVRIHVDWPSSQDPFYLANPPDNDARIDYYGIDGVPAQVVDGLYDLEWYGGDHYSVLGAYYDAPLLADLFVQVEELGGGDYTVDVHVYATDELTESRELTLHTMVTQSFLSYDDPFPNGETEFADAVIDFLPDGGGAALALEPGDEPQVVSFDFQLGDDWEPGVMEVVAFLQDDATLEVLQAGTSEEVPAHSFRVVDSQPNVMVIEPDGTASFETRLQNTSIAADSFDLSLDTSATDGWTDGWTLNGEVPGEDEPVVEIGGGGEAGLEMTFDANGNVGVGTATLTVRPHGEDEPELVWSVEVLTYGADVLVVDADGGEAFENYAIDSLVAGGYSYTVWSAPQGLEDVDLSRFGAVVWNAGWYFPHFTELEKAQVADFLDSGGKLFISGQDIGWDLADAGSPWLDENFYETNLHASYESDDTNIVVDLAGVAGDPIGDGLVFDISGGTGADNQEFPSWVEPSGDGAERIIEYSDGSGAAIRAAHGVASGRVVYLAFGFESIADDTTRDLLLARSLAWLLE